MKKRKTNMPIVDGSKVTRGLLKTMMKDEYTAIEVTNGDEFIDSDEIKGTIFISQNIFNCLQ